MTCPIQNLAAILFWFTDRGAYKTAFSTLCAMGKLWLLADFQELKPSDLIRFLAVWTEIGQEPGPLLCIVILSINVKKIAFGNKENGSVGYIFKSSNEYCNTAYAL